MIQMRFRQAARAVTALALGLAALTVAGCAPGDDQEDAVAGGPEAAISFPAEPPDGPMPEIGPAPEGYTPTAAGSPSTDIWMAALVREGGALSIPDLGRATDRDAYDNQPGFLLDGSAILHTSAIDRTQTEIMRLMGPGVGSGASERLTNTAEASEFSALQIPGQDAFSAIHEIRGKQYLWRYDLSGEPLGPIFATAEPVGYHAWANERVVAMFILGNPPTLQVGDAVSGEIEVVAERPGRSIHRIPGTEEISFVRKVSDEEWWIERLDPGAGTSERITQTLPGREDYAWTPEGEILMGDGSRLYARSEGSEWTEIADFSDLGVEGISRLAVSPDGSRIALVANRPGG
ncbi:hypothetical protein [Candidatus Palauibacter sp.]|uniref:hypothetical protein n=1 Tax=Candidatus Palauibacter sp. TaxID=3101350 RepID=UPI003AF2957A